LIKIMEENTPKKYIETDPNSLYYPVIKLTKDENDWLLFEDMVRHCLALGATGGGKTSAWGRYYLHHMMKAGCGGLVLTVKRDEVDFVKEIAKKSGRIDDVIEFSLSSGHTFNFLDYTLEKAKESGSPTYVNRLLKLFKNVVSMQAGSSDVTDNKDAFWIDAMEELLSHTIRTLIYAGEQVSLENIYDMVSTLPENKEDWEAYNKGENQDLMDRYFFKMFTKAGDKINQTKSIAQKNDEQIRMLRGWKIISNYFQVRLSQYDIKTKATFVQMFSGMANKLMEDGIREAFSTGKTNITPEMTFDGKIIILNIPYLEEGDNARICQVIFKYCWQKEVERRITTKDDKFVFLYCDEAQYFVTRNDPQFLSTARSAKACVCYMTQNINGLSRYLGFNKMNLNSFLGNFQTNIFHQNGDYDTNEYASKLIGKTEIEKVSFSETDSSGAVRSGLSKSKTTSKQWENQLQTSDFSDLQGGGKNSEMTVESVIFLTGRRWSDEKNYLRFRGSQE
jgi:type IV secretory pathway TraG/TraD family ATPase VirD4